MMAWLFKYRAVLQISIMIFVIAGVLGQFFLSKINELKSEKDRKELVQHQNKQNFRLAFLDQNLISISFKIYLQDGVSRNDMTKFCLFCDILARNLGNAKFFIEGTDEGGGSGKYKDWVNYTHWTKLDNLKYHKLATGSLPRKGYLEITRYVQKEDDFKLDKIRDFDSSRIRLMIPKDNIQSIKSIQLILNDVMVFEINNTNWDTKNTIFTEHPNDKRLKEKDWLLIGESGKWLGSPDILPFELKLLEILLK